MNKAEKVNLSRGKTIALVVLGIVVIYTGVLFWLLNINAFQPDKFIHAGDHFTRSEDLSKQISVLQNSYGYDGQFYYRLALNPFTNMEESNGIVLDQPALRHQRILYPLTAFALSFGHDGPLPALLILINFVAIVTLAVVGTIWARALGLHSLSGGVMALYPGLLFSLSHDLTEILASACGLAALLLFLKKSYFWTAILLTLGLFTRETTLIFALGISIGLFSNFILNHKIAKTEILSLVIPLTLFASWQIFLWYVWGEIPILLVSNLNIDWPLRGLIKGISNWKNITVYNVIELAFIGVTLLSAGWAFRNSATPSFIKYSWIVGLAIFLLWGSVLWVEDLTFMRAFTELFFLSYIVILGSKSPLRTYFPIILAALFVTVFSLRFI